MYQPMTVVVYNTTTEAATTSQAVQGMQSGCILVPVHPGLELWDRIEITDPRACFSPTQQSALGCVSRRVAGIETTYDKRRAAPVRADGVPVGAGTVVEGAFAIVNCGGRML